jgi:hypothetical protein
MNRPDYTEFDNALLDLISNGHDTLMKLDSVKSGLREMAEPHRVQDRWGSLTPTYRIIDRRLQAQRKKGVIRFNGKAWERVPKDRP